MKKLFYNWFLAVSAFLGLLGGSATAQEKLFSIDGNDFLLQDLTPQTTTLYQSMRYNRALNVWNCEIVLQNQGSNAIEGPFVLRVESFSGTSGPQNPDGTSEAKPFFSLGNWVTNNVLQPGQKSAPRTLTLGFIASQSPSLVCKLYARSSANFAVGLTHSLDEFGQPLGDVFIEETGPQGEKTYSSDSISALSSLGQVGGDHVWKFSKPGYLPVWRRENLLFGTTTLIGSPRLVLRNTNSILTSTGGQIDEGRGDIQVTFPSGVLSGNVSVSLTALSGQTLPAFLPRGWSPLQAFWLELSSEPTGSASALLKLWGNLDAGEPAALARWNATNLVWDVLQLAAGAGTNNLSISLPGSGAYAVVVADAGVFAPPVAVAGQSLIGTSVAFTNYTALSAGGRVTPATSPASKVAAEVTAAADLNITNLSGAIPSGILLRGAVTEVYHLQGGMRRMPPQYESFLAGYQRPGDANVATLAATFPVRPQILFGADELLEATVMMDVFPPGSFGGGILQPGGSQVSADGITIVSGPGDVTNAQAVILRRLDITNFLGFSTNIVFAFELEVAGLVGGQDLRALFATNEPNSFFVLARVMDEGGILGLQPVERFSTGTNGILVSVEPPAGDRLPGIVAAGQYVLVKVGAAQALVKGVAGNSSGLPTGGIVVRLGPWTTFSASDGSYRLIAPLGSAVLSFLESSTGDSGSAAISVSDTQATVVVNGAAAPTGPRVSAVSPVHQATAVPRVTSVMVTFSEPINPGSLGTNGLQLIGTNGQPVAATLSLNLKNTMVTLLPTAQLRGNSLHTLHISTNITDLNGLKLEGTNSFTFTTETDALNRLAAQIISYEPTNGLAKMEGTPGIADPNVPVILVNETRGTTATVLSGPDGSFANFIEADVDDFLSAVLVNQNGTRNSIPVSRQLFSDGSVGLFEGGGILEAESDGGPVQIIVEPGAIETKTKLRIQPLSTQELTNFLGGITPQGGGKVLSGLKYESSGDELTTSADVRMPLNLDDLPPGGDPTNAVFAAVVLREVNGVKVFEIADKLEYKDGYLESHSPPFCGLSCMGDVFNIMAVWLGYGGKVVAEGLVVAEGGGSPEKPVRGATVFVAGGPTALEANGRVSEGTVVALTDEKGEFALLANLQEDSTKLAVLASSLRFPDRFGQGMLQTLHDNHARAKGRVTFVRGGPSTAGPDNIPPIITMSHAPFEPATNEDCMLRVFATDNAGAPTISVRVGSATSLSLSDTVRRQDIQVQVQSLVTQPQSLLATYKVRSPKAAYVTLDVTATDDSGNIVITDYALTIGATDTEPVLPPSPNDRVGPWVLSMTPRNGVSDYDRFQPIRIIFSEPVSDTFLGNIQGAVRLTPSAGVPFATLSPDKRELTLSYPNLEAGADYSLSINSQVRDLNNNRFDQNPQNNPNGVSSILSLDTFTSQFKTKSVYFARLPGMANGAGVVAGKGHLFALERKGSTGYAGLKVYDKDATDLPVLVGYLQLPDYPRDLVLIKDYGFVDANGQKRTNDIVVAIGGLVGSQTGQWIWAIDVTNPNGPTRLVDTTITQDPTAVVMKLAWSPPMVGYLEVGSEFSAVGLINLQLFLFANRLPNLDAQPLTGRAGTDVNGDGDYVDPGDVHPLPASQRLIQGVVNGGLVNAYTLGDTNVADMVDFALEFGGRFVGVVHNAEGAEPAGYRTLASDGLPMESPDGVFAFPQRPDRLLLVFGAQIDTTNGPTAANLALISNGKPRTLTVLDISVADSPVFLSDIPMPSGVGPPKSASVGSDGMILLSTDTDVLVLNSRRIGLPTTANGHPAVVGVMKALGSGGRSFVGESPDFFAVNMGGRARVTTTNAAALQFRVSGIVGIDRNLDFALDGGVQTNVTERRSSAGLLEVTINSAETLTFEAGIDPDGLTVPPGFPVWSLDDINPKNGVTVEYSVPGWGVSPSFGTVFYFQGGVTPKEHKVRAETALLTVNVYPNKKTEPKIEIKKFEEVFKNTMSNAQAFVQTYATAPLRPTFNIDPPSGKIAFANQWKECPSSHLAYWAFDLEAGLDPVVGIKGGILAQIPVPGFLHNYIHAEVSLNMSGAFQVKGKISRSECGEISGSVPASLKVGVSLEAEAKAGNALSVILACESSITGGGNLVLDNGGLLLEKTKVDWDGVTAKATVKVAGGLLEFTDEWVITPPVNLIPESAVPVTLLPPAITVP